MLGWVVTLLILQNLFRNQITFNPKDLSFHVDMELGCTDPYFGRENAMSTEVLEATLQAGQMSFVITFLRLAPKCTQSKRV